MRIYTDKTVDEEFKDLGDRGYPFKRHLRRAEYPRALSMDAERFNAPRHWGKAVEAGSETENAEIKPVTEPKLRRVKARRVVA